MLHMTHYKPLKGTMKAVCIGEHWRLCRINFTPSLIVPFLYDAEQGILPWDASIPSSPQ